LRSGINRGLARLVGANVELVGVEELAFLLVRIREVASDEYWGQFSNRSSDNLVINARIVVPKREGSSEPRPLKCPSSIGQIQRNCDNSVAGS